MKNSENRKFEESWRNAFADAESDPSDTVWTNVDLQLSRAESGSMKRRVLFYQRLAAASVVFALALSGLGIWYSTRNKTELLTNSLQEQEDATQEFKKGRNRANDVNTNASANAARSSGNKQTSGSGKLKKTERKPVKQKNRVGDEASQQAILYVESQQDRQKMIETKSDSVPSEVRFAEANDQLIKKNNEVSLNESSTVVSKNKEELAMNPPMTSLFVEPVIAQVESKKKTKADEDWWASLGGSAGSYNPNSGAAPVYASAYGNSSTSSQQSSRSKAGTSISFGMNFGKKIAPRLMLMSGFNFLSQSTEYNSNVARSSGSNSSAFAADALSQASVATTNTTPYTVSNVSEFVSVPFQAGYLFIDRKVGLQLNAGVASDFFLKNTLTDQTGKLLRYTQGAGDNSLYRSVNWTGLMGTEVSYKVAEHYRVSVVPGVRYSFNSVLKSTTGATLNPIVWDVGFRFRYMF